MVNPIGNAPATIGGIPFLLQEGAPPVGNNGKRRNVFNILPAAVGSFHLI